MPVRNENRGENRQRLLEIMEVMRRHEIVKGITPEKLCAIIEELGPTFIKLGQILSMRSDILPAAYCDALKKLRSSVAPMPYEQIAAIVEKSYGRPLEEVFASFDHAALGSASIAQAHAAVLQTGEPVVVKVQREGIHEIMSRDIMLLKQASKLLKYTPASGLVDFNQVLDEMWVVAQEEMNFQTEAANLERFRKLNEDVAFVTSPILYRQYTTTQVLVMERIDGMGIDKKDELTQAGYDLAEIGAKLADNYVRQIMEDGFFHADPHPGNVHIWDGRIVWLDLGMMGTLTKADAELIKVCMKAIFSNDYVSFADAVLNICEHDPELDREAYYARMQAYLDKYRVISMAQMSSTVDIFADLYRIARDFGIKVPKSFTMFWRSLSIMEGTVSDLSPKTDLAAIIGRHMAAQAMVKGVAGSITRKISHRRLVSGSALHYNGNDLEPDEEFEEGINEPEEWLDGDTEE